MNRHIQYFILAMMAFPLFLAAQNGPPPRRFDRGPTSRPFWGWGMHGMMEASGQRIHHRNMEPTTEPTDQQWHDIAEYMKRDLPNAWEVYERQPPDRQAMMKRQIFAEFEATEELRQTNQIELYKLKLRERKIKDDVAGLIKKWRRASISAKPEIREQLRGKLHQLLLATLQERELRIKRLEDQLKDAKDRLAQDRKQIEDMVDRRTSRLLNPGAPHAEPAGQRAEPATRPAE